MGKEMNGRPSSYRGRLLATASTVVLVMSVCEVGDAKAAEANYQQFWVELGWQFERMPELGDVFSPPFTNTSAWVASGFASPDAKQKMLMFSSGADGKISFQPEGSNWSFSASMRFGRSHGRKNAHEQTSPSTIPVSVVVPALGIDFHGKAPPQAARFATVQASQGETHLLADFEVGKDVGLGLFGHSGTSTLSAGVRFAQFKSTTHENIAADPDFQFVQYQITRFFGYSASGSNAYQYWHHYTNSGESIRTFQGIGPSLSWHSSDLLVGDADDGELTLDWGVNAAALFGRQKTKVSHQTSGAGVCYGPGSKCAPFRVSYQNPSVIHERTRSLIVPNAGGVAGLSYRIQGFKVSFGYRADFFFGAIDSGVDARHETTRSFNGPFASVSFGVSPSDF
jgi:iron complex outermembrane receptor protein